MEKKEEKGKGWKSIFCLVIKGRKKMRNEKQRNEEGRKRECLVFHVSLKVIFSFSHHLFHPLLVRHEGVRKKMEWNEKEKKFILDVRRRRK